MRGVGVGEPKMGDPPLTSQLIEIAHGIEPGGVRIAPGMELEEVDPLDAHPHAGAVDGGAHHLARDRPRLGDPLGEELRGRRPGPGAEATDDLLRRPVVVGHVEGGEPGSHVGPHRIGGAVEIEGAAIALLIRHLPEPGEDPRDRQIRTDLVVTDGTHG